MRHMWWLMMTGCGVGQWTLAVSGSDRLQTNYPLQAFADDCFFNPDEAAVVLADAVVEEEGGRSWDAFPTADYYAYDTWSYSYDDYSPVGDYAGAGTDLHLSYVPVLLAADVPMRTLKRMEVSIKPVADPWVTDIALPAALVNGDASISLAGEVHCGLRQVRVDFSVPLTQRWSCPLGDTDLGDGVAPTTLEIDVESWFRTSLTDGNAPRRLQAWLDADTNGSQTLSRDELEQGWLDPELYDLGGEEVGLLEWVTRLAPQTTLMVDGEPCDALSGE